MKQKMMWFCVGLLCVLTLVSSLTSAITASLGNSRMVLRGDVGEEIERSLLVKNVNNVTVSINITTSGDLADSIELEEAAFTLAPNTDKRVSFTITPDSVGTTESNINVRFAPEQGSGVGLSATIIVIAGGSDTAPQEDPSDSAMEDEEKNPSSGFSLRQNASNAPAPQGKALTQASLPLIFLTISTLVLVIVLVVLVRIKSKKRVKRSHA